MELNELKIIDAQKMYFENLGLKDKIKVFEK